METNETNLGSTAKSPIEAESAAVTEANPSDGFKKIAGSIIFGAILISASILYTGYKLHGDSFFGQVKGETTGTAGTAGTATEAAKPRATAAVIGNKNAKVTMIEFADFQCPFCQNYFKETYSQIKQKYIDTGKVKYIFMHYPLAFHVNAEISSVAAECANQEGKFWEYHDVLFANAKADGTNLATADLKKYGKDLGLGSSFEQCLDGGKTLDIVKADFNEGSASGVSGTPSFFINGEKVVGAQPFSKFEQVIESKLK